MSFADINILPLLLSAIICVVWTAIGYGFINELGASLSSTRRMLLAPVTGLSVCTLIGALLNRLGLPVEAFGRPVLAIILALAIVYLFKFAPTVRWRPLLAWAGVAMVSMCIVGWPSLQGGFDWISFGNGDMLQYINGADHFLKHGYYQLPPRDIFFSEKDESWNYSLSYSLGEVRWASQLILAWLVNIVGLPAANAFMPLMLAVHATLLLTVTAYAYEGLGERLAFAVFLVISVSANVSLGTFYNLLPQDFGIAVLTASSAMLLLPPLERKLLRRSVLAAIYVATLLIAYPEVLPFLFLSIGLYLVISIFRRKTQFKRWAYVYAVTAGLGILLSNLNFVGAVHSVIFNLAVGQGVGGPSLFPYYLTPAAFALMWGFLPYGQYPSTFLDEAYIVVGAIAYPVALILSLRGAWRLQPVAITSASMLPLFALFFKNQSGFGLFKLSMYAQPFILSVLTISLVHWIRIEDFGWRKKHTVTADIV